MTLEGPIVATLAVIYSLTTFLCAIYYYTRFRRWQYGKKAVAKVLEHWTEYESTDDGAYSNATHYYKFSFVDDHTDKYLPVLIQKYMTVLSDDVQKQYSTLPPELITLICQFMAYDNSIVFFKGPFEVTRKATTDVMGLSEKVNIIYDFTNPYNVDFEIVQNDRFCSRILLCAWMIVTGYVVLQLHWILSGWVTLAMMVLSGMFAGLSIIGIPYFAGSMCKRNKLYRCCAKESQLHIEWDSENSA